MPANEQTWRDSKLMHTVFAVSAVVMLLATVWMMGDDNDRPWKDYQRKFNNLELWNTQARITEQQSTQYSKDLTDLERKVKEAQSKFTEADEAAAIDFTKNDPVFTDELARLVKANHRDFEVTRDPAQDEAIRRQAEETAKLKDKDAIRDSRATLLELMNKVMARYTFREDHFTQETKDRKAELSAVQSQYDQAVGLPPPGQTVKQHQQDLKRRQAVVDQADREANTSGGLKDKAAEQRKEMDRIRGLVTAAEDKANAAVAAKQQSVKLLMSSAEDRSMNVGKQLVELPILDAFNSPLKIDNNWLPDLPWNNNFKQVARFDRCGTCHMGMTKTQPGSAVDPSYPAVPEEPQKFVLAPPAKAPPAKPQPTLESVYGFTLAPRGALNPNDVTIYAVYPQSLAASAGLMGGDVISAINDATILRSGQVHEYLLETPVWGQPLTISVRRGVPHPYATHPRLDLYLGSLSPHPVSKFGCSICHQGQGSETSFKWATHTPNNLIQARNWTQQYNWFRNEDWTWPMFPKRFVESGCLKCHHDIVDLLPSKKYPDPPAPKLIAGYETIRRYGCFGCHEINSYNGPDKRIGPDLRLEPQYYAAAQQLKDDPGLAKLDKQAPQWADDVIERDDVYARRRLLELVSADAATAKKAQDGTSKSKPVLRADSHRMEAVLKDVDLPGTQRKVGPSLRHVGSKLSYEFLVSWIANPKNFRPDTRMPRFFGLWDHLDGAGLAESQRFEPIEIRALAEYLLKASQPFDYIKPPSGIEPDAELTGADHTAAITRGKKVFQTRGCLACHKHADFPDAMETQGPDLSRIGAKLATNPHGRDWLYSWVRQPNHYHRRTFMPNLFLEPIKDASGKMTDPADDVTEFLMTSQQGWKPEMALARQLTGDEENSLNDLALLYLSDKFPTETAKRYLRLGINPSEGYAVMGDETVLINPELPPPGTAKSGNPLQSEETEAGLKAANEPVTGEGQDRVAIERASGAAGGAPVANETPEQKQKRLARTMEYVGRRTIGKFGCFGCHDIPGYEDAKTIGTGLADWGRKDPSRLAFEEIIGYVTKHPNGLHPSGIRVQQQKNNTSGIGEFGSPLSSADTPLPYASSVGPSRISAAPLTGKIPPAQTSDLSLEDLPTDIGFFMNELLEEDRTGFLWQKLRSPRSYDFRKTGERGYNVRLRMPQFTFAVDPNENQKKIEQVMTFVLGLVSEPPPDAYLAKPDSQEAAIVAGRKVIEKYNCTGCHTLEMDRWTVRLKPGDLGSPPKVSDYDFEMPHFSDAEIASSKATDRRGDMKADLVGMPVMSDRDGKPLRVDEDGAPIEAGDTASRVFYQFMLFQNALVDGQSRLVGAQNLRIPADQIVKESPPLGGDLARMLYPIVIADEAKTNPGIRSQATQAWGWLPPPLEGEGKKVQSDWLHNFLLDPFPIRPAVVLRMPKFNMSSDEASMLVHYFAAHDNAEYPYEFDARSRGDHVEQMEAKHPKYLESGLNIVTDSNYCVKCHLIGDFSPGGSTKAMGPRLDRVYSRLRPDYMQRWIGDPPRILPYTLMPVNIPPNKPADQKLFAGSSEEQLNGVVDLLANFDRLAESQLSIKARVKTAPLPAEAKPSTASSSPPASNAGKETE